MNKNKNILLPIIAASLVTLILATLLWNYTETIRDQNKIERERILNERNGAILERKAECATLKNKYIKTSEPTTEIAFDEVVYNEKENTCYYYYSQFRYNSLTKVTTLDEAITDLYSGNFVASTEPVCAGQWCMTKDDFDKKKQELGFTNTH